MTHSTFDFQPIVIIGAARSGTNMLRDMLTRIPGVSTWPCDEINYIWRHHNATLPHDELTSAHARPQVSKYIRRAFAKQARRDGSRLLIEKTCANSLRVGFVDAVIPEAKYIFLVRDGRDVVASALQRWKAKLDPSYLLKKARFVPPSDLAYYAVRYFCHVAHRLVSAEKRLSVWGPRFVGMQDMLANKTLEEVCAEQWTRSVALASNSFGQIETARCVQLRYEDLVQNPERELNRVVQTLDIGADARQVRQAIGKVSDSSIGNWRRKLAPEILGRIAPIMTSQLQLFGYDLAADHKQKRAA